jgi:hypothetical protein
VKSGESNLTVIGFGGCCRDFRRSLIGIIKGVTSKNASSVVAKRYTEAYKKVSAYTSTVSGML